MRMNTRSAIFWAGVMVTAVLYAAPALAISRPYLPFGDVEAFADRVMRSACCGHIVTGMLGLDVPPMEAVTKIKGLVS